MSKKRTILIEAALVVSVLATGIVAAQAARAAPIAGTMQAAGDTPAVDPRANVKIESKIQVERTEDGVSKLYDPADVKVVPGDRLVFTNAYKNTGRTPVTGFVVNNPVHPAVTFTGVSEDWATVSVDGGKNFGKLVDLVVTEAAPAVDGEAKAGNDVASPTEMITRPAQPADVTHVRWVFAEPIGAGASGALQFRGLVK